jgi:hypothetical protein
MSGMLRRYAGVIIRDCPRLCGVDVRNFDNQGRDLLVKKVDEGHVGGQINDARIKVKRGSSFANREAQRRVAP